MEYGFPVELYPTQQKIVRDAIDAIRSRKTIVLDSPTGTGKTLALLCAALNFISKPNEEDEIIRLLSKCNRQTVYYCSRTHTQLAQVISELKRNEHKYNAVVLGSRRMYCVNDKIKNIKSLDELNNKCKEAVKTNSCEYYGGSFFTSDPQDIEDLVNLAKEHKFCPYYFSREHAYECEIVFLPYNLIFTKNRKECSEINLEDKIVIIDEAHNLYNSIIELNSAEICWKELKIISALEGLPEKLKEILKRLAIFRQRITRETISDILSFLSAARLKDFNMFEVDDEIQEKRIAQKKDMPVIFQLSKFLKLLTFSDASGRVIYSPEYIRFTPMSPELYMQNLKKCRSIILAGGTMEPIGPLRKLFPEMNYSAYPAISTDFIPLIVTETAQKKPIKLSYEERGEQIDGVVKTLVSLSCTVRSGGIIIFVPSKSFIDLIRTNPNINYFKRKVYFDKYTTFNEYSKDPQILFAVLGGKLSEGINFSNELCRLVIIVGVPYPTLSLESCERQKHSSDFQVNEAMRRVNQALGRALRHKTDYAAMVLLDVRYLSLQRHVSKWIREKLRVATLPEAIRQIHKFLQR